MNLQIALSHQNAAAILPCGVFHWVDATPFTDKSHMHDLEAISLTGPEKISGQVELIWDQMHLARVIREGVLQARVSIDLATADFKAMLVPTGGRGRARSIVSHLAELARRGVEVRVLHAGVPSGPALAAIKQCDAAVLRRFVMRRCPRLHAKAVIVDSRQMYLGSANLTGAGLGAKGADRRNLEWGIWTESSALIEGVSAQFNALWEGARCTTCKRKDICPVPLEEPRLG